MTMMYLFDNMLNHKNKVFKPLKNAQSYWYLTLNRYRFYRYRNLLTKYNEIESTNSWFKDQFTMKFVSHIFSKSSKRGTNFKLL